jgi:hypothetical protein
MGRRSANSVRTEFKLAKPGSVQTGARVEAVNGNIARDCFD